MFKGHIGIGTTVEAVLSLAHTSSGPALVMIAHSAGPSDGDTVAPGGSVTVSITPDERGILRVVVDVKEESDRAKLEVRPVTPAEDIEGDTTWGYVVA